MKRRICVIALTLFINTVCLAQDYYWIGNGGDWKDPAHWSLTSGGATAGVVPAPTDNAYFDANSFTLPGQIVHIYDDGSEIGVEVNTMDWRGVTNNPTFEIKAVTSEWVGNTLKGSLYFDPNMTLDFEAAEFYMDSSTDYDFDTQGHYLGQNCFLEFSGFTTGTAHVLSDINHAWVYVNIGTFNLNGHTFIGQSDSDYPSLRLVGTVSTPAIADLSNSTIDIGTLQISAYSTLIDDNAVMTIRKQLNASDQNFNHITITGPDVSLIGSSSHTFETLEILPDTKLTLNSGIQTINTLIANGTTLNPITLVGGTLSKSTGTILVRDAHIQNSTATGGATFKAIRSWDDGGNTGWNFLTNPTDSLALVSLYNSTAGSGWKNKTNWLTGPVNTWYGIGVTAGRVTRVTPTNNNLVGSLPPEIGNLSALFEITLDDNKLSGPIPPELGNITDLNVLSFSRNQLSGTIPTELGNFTGLTQFWLDNNQLTGAVPASLANLISVQMFFIGNNKLSDLPNLSTLTATTTFSVINNKFTFEDLEPNISIPAFAYIPQDSVELKKEVLRQLGSVDSLVAVVGGTANTFQWYKNNSAIAGATTKQIAFPNIAISDDATYHYEVTNNLVPGLTLYRRPIEFKVSSLYRDSIALRTLYEVTEGATWTNNSNWLTTPLKTGNWFGITITSDRVTQVNLPNNNLKGPVTAVVADIQNLTSLNLSNNKITALPDLSTYPSISTLDVSGNRLDFGSLEKNAAILGINYSSQANLGTALDTLVSVGSPAKLKLATGGTTNAYQWKRNGQDIAGATSSSYQIEEIGRSNMGDYTLEITNTSVPGLTLKSATQRATAVANVSGKLQLNASTPVTNGEMLLLKINPGGVGYDTTRIQSVQSDGTYLLDKIVLDDYVMVGLGDLVQYKDYFPTYFDGSVFWEEATRIELNENRVGLDIALSPLPSAHPVGDGELSGTFSVSDLPGGRTQKARIEGSGASVRRGTKTGRPTETLEGEDIVAFLYTNENGEFDFKDLEEGSYILNIQYPGVPMDKESDIYITLGPKAKRQNVQKVEALAEAGKITVKRLIIVGIEAKGEEQVKVYPNPVAEELFIEMEQGSGEGIAVLTDTMGREYKRIQVLEEMKVMNVRDLTSGIYVLTIHQQGQQISRSKIVIK